MSTTDEDWICGESYDHNFPEPEYIDGMAVLICRECGAEIFEDEVEVAPVPREDVAVAEVAKVLHLTQHPRNPIEAIPDATDYRHRYAACYLCVDLAEALAPLIAERERVAAVEAWDQGYMARWNDMGQGEHRRTRNPYPADRRAER